MTALERFEALYMPEPNSGCWLWLGVCLPRGYPRFWNGKREVYAYRWAYEYWVGDIPENLQIDHLCRNPPCVNPAHLEPVTNQENKRRATLAKTHCPHGHPYSGDNLYITPLGHRSCKKCNRDHQRRYRREGRYK